MFPRRQNSEALQNFTGFCGIGKGFSRYLPPTRTPRGPPDPSPMLSPMDCAVLHFRSTDFPFLLWFWFFLTRRTTASLGALLSILTLFSKQQQVWKLILRTRTLFVRVTTTGKIAHWQLQPAFNTIGLLQHVVEFNTEPQTKPKPPSRSPRSTNDNHCALKWHDHNLELWQRRQGGENWYWSTDDGHTEFYLIAKYLHRMI